MKEKSKEKRTLLIFSAVYFIVFAFLAAVGTVYDLPIDKAVFNPQSDFAVLFEAFSPAVLYGMWGPALTVLMLLLSRIGVGGVIDEIAKTLNLKIKNRNTKAFFVLERFMTYVLVFALFALSIIGYRKFTANTLKHFLTWSEVVYYSISAVFAVVFALIFSRLKTGTLKKLGIISSAAILFGIVLKGFEELKTVTQRVRFREMVAYSNGIVDKSGKSTASVKMLQSKLERAMIDNTDFSAFRPWYIISKDFGIYGHCDSFPSGHTFDSCTVFFIYPLVSAFKKCEKYAGVALAFSFVYVFAVAFSRLVAGAHYLTDVAFGAMLGYGAFLIVYAIMKKIQVKFYIV